VGNGVDAADGFVEGAQDGHVGNFDEGELVAICPR
jgi:hypothetical protein